MPGIFAQYGQQFENENDMQSLSVEDYLSAHDQALLNDIPPNPVADADFDEGGMGAPDSSDMTGLGVESPLDVGGAPMSHQGQDKEQDVARLKEELREALKAMAQEREDRSLNFQATVASNK